MSYREQFFALQPPGQALPTDPDSVWGRLLDGLAREYYIRKISIYIIRQ